MIGNQTSSARNFWMGRLAMAMLVGGITNAAIGRGPTLATVGDPPALVAANGVQETTSIAVESPGVALATQHLRGLLPVLRHLQRHSPPDYEKAIRDLDRAAKRLETIKRRDELLYRLSLSQWQVRGQLDLLKARVRVKDTAADRNAILERLKQLKQLEIRRIEREMELLTLREQDHRERIVQAQTAIERGHDLRMQWVEQHQRAVSERIDEQSPVYLDAIGLKPGRTSQNPVETDKPKSK